MKSIIPLLLAALATSCAPKPPPLPPNYRPQATVPQAASPQPQVDALRASHAEADAIAAANQTRSETVSREAATLKAGISKAMAEADRLRKQKAATEAELDALWQMLSAENKRAAELFAEAERHRNAALEERRLRTVATAKLDDLQTALANLAAERNALRLQLTDAEDASQAAHHSAHQQFVAANKAQTEADNAKGSIKVWRNIAFGFFASTVILIFILFYKPRFI